MKNDIVYVNESDEYHLACEAVRSALTDALLRSRDGCLRIPNRTALTSMEEHWVNDVAKMLVGDSLWLEDSPAPQERGGMRFVRVVRDRLASALWRRRESTAMCEASEGELHYVPIACGQQGDVREIYDGGEVGQALALSSIHRPPTN